MEGVERKPEALLDEETLSLLKEQERQSQEQDDIPIEETLVRHVHPAKFFLFGALLAVLFIAIITSITTESSMTDAILGFLPTIVAVILYILLLEGDYKDVLFWIVPLALGFLFFVTGTYLLKQLDVPVLAAVNIILSYAFLGVMFLIEYRKVPEATLQDLEQFKPEQLDKYLHTIEEKCKAINFAIGRVYRMSNGGTAGMRDKLKVPPEWYNEFHNVEDQKAQKDVAIALLIKIHDRLSILIRPEKDVFHEHELKGLKNLARDKDGKDRIIDVLIVNDNDPVEDYFLGAMDFCKKIAEKLEKK